MSQAKIRVLIVDDSATFRMLLSKVLSADPEIEVVGFAPDPFVAREKIVELQPDVITLDIEMPKMDGVTFLSKLMNHFPVRAVVISSLSVQGSEAALRALEAGAIDVMPKPKMVGPEGIAILSQELLPRVKGAANARLVGKRFTRSAPPKAPVAPLAEVRKATLATVPGVIAIASSTGGTEALKEVLPFLPEDIPPTVIVQHMPEVFTKTYSQALQRLCPFEVREAQDGDRLEPGLALLAPGNWHMELEKHPGGGLRVKLHQQPQLFGVRPAADYLLKSVARLAGPNSIGVVLTGMGRDGADGLLEMRQSGSHNIGQDEASCVVYGMPKSAFEKGALHQILPLDQIADAITARLTRTRTRRTAA
jgi:two-component system chemotaxis response regulator CheB